MLNVWKMAVFLRALGTLDLDLWVGPGTTPDADRRDAVAVCVLVVVVLVLAAAPVIKYLVFR